MTKSSLPQIPLCGTANAWFQQKITKHAKGNKERQSEETKQLLEIGSDMTQMQELVQGVFKVTVINRSFNGNCRKCARRWVAQIETLRDPQKMLEIKNNQK